MPCRRHPLGCVRFRPVAASAASPAPHKAERLPGSDGTGSLRSRTTAVLRAVPLPPSMPGQRKPHPRGRTPAQRRRDLPGREKGRDHDPQIHAGNREDPDDPHPPGAPVHHLRVGRATCPHQGLTDNLVRTFGLEPVDYDGIRDATAEHIARAAKAFGTALNEKALQIHLQRITGAFVGSAFGAAQFYGTKKSAAMELTSKLLNDERDEDRDGPAGFESKAERARLFAAEMALQAFALMAAAEGAISAYADITGEAWKPYEAPAHPPPRWPASPPPSRWPRSRWQHNRQSGRSRSGSAFCPQTPPPPPREAHAPRRSTLPGNPTRVLGSLSHDCAVHPGHPPR